MLTQVEFEDIGLASSKSYRQSILDEADRGPKNSVCRCYETERNCASVEARTLSFESYEQLQKRVRRNMAVNQVIWRVNAKLYPFYERYKQRAPTSKDIKRKRHNTGGLLTNYAIFN